MPTGYTAKLMKNGQTFREFALGCARAFGACVTMRDDETDAPIPEKFEPSDLNVKALAKAERELKRLSRFTPAQQLAFGNRAKKKEVECRKKYARAHREEDARIDDMVRRVKAWSEPSQHHANLKVFMLEQLELSRNGADYWDGLVVKSEAKSPIDYYTDALAAAARDIKYHREEIEKERARVEGRNRWLQQLRASLPAA